MIAALRFDETGRPEFSPATNVRLAAVCGVANAVTEHLSRLLDRAVMIDIFEPVTVPIGAAPAIFADAAVSLAHARRSDLLVVIRDRDARRLVECAFRVEPGAIGERDFSAIENQVLDRVVSEIAHLCTPLCGEISSIARANGPIDAYACATYFEFRLAPPVDVVIGLGLARDPAPQAEVRLSPAALATAPVQLTARLGRKRIAARRLADFRAGMIVAFDTALGDPAQLLAGDVVVAHGECGIHNGLHALRITSTGKAAPR